MLLAPAITEKVQATIVGHASGVCGVPLGDTIESSFQVLFQTHPCYFTYTGWELNSGVVKAYPQSGKTPSWDTAGGMGFTPGDEAGSVTFKVGGGEAQLFFNNPASGTNTCEVKILSGGPGDLTGNCEASQGLHSEMTYSLHSLAK